MSKASRKTEDAREEPLTAILLADSFTTKLRPVTIEQPKVLLPLCNSRIIDYTLEWLASQSVRVVYVICCAHADKVRAYLAASKWMREPELSVRFITSYNCLSAGEALRLVDSEGIIKDDFVLVTGDTVTNMNLSAALAAHKDRRAKDKNAIMTMVMTRRVDATQRLRLGINDLAVAVDPLTNRLLSYINYEDCARPGDMVGADATFFSERDTLQLRMDLQDTEIYICAPEVLVLFSDNFDYQAVRRDFITGVLSEEELGNKLFVYPLENEYAMRVYNFRTYDAVSRDVLMRWVHPKVPDSNLLPPVMIDTFGQSEYFVSRDYRYREADVNCARTAVVGPCTCLGAGTSVGPGSVLSECVIGRGCRIGANVTIQRSYILGGITIGDGARIVDSFVCDNVSIGKGAVLPGGCVISYGCVVSPGFAVPMYARVTLCKVGEDLMSEDSDAETEEPLRRFGSGAAAPADEPSSSSCLPEEDVLQAARSMASGQGAAYPFDTDVVGPEGAGFNYYAQHNIAPGPLDFLCSIRLPPKAVADVRIEHITSHAEHAHRDGDAESDDGDTGTLMDPERTFKREVTETLLRCMHLANTTASTKASTKEELHENAVIELNALKIAEVRTFADCARYVLTTIMGLSLPPPPGTPSQFHSLFKLETPDVSKPPGQLALLKDLRANLAKWASLLQRFLKEQEDQIELLVTLEEYLGAEGVFEGSDAGDTYVPIFSHILMELYEQEIITEEAFLTWEKAKQSDDEEDKTFLNKAANFLQWLRSADEAEGSSEEDDEDDEDEDDDDEDGDEDDD